MKLLRTLAVSVLAVALVCAAAYGAGQLSRGTSVASDDRTAADGGTPDTQEPTAEPRQPTVSPATLRPGPVLEPGDRGPQVRELQSRLFQLAWFPELTSGSYDATTREAVSGFQAKRGLRASGIVDRRTWGRLVAMTEQPTHDQLFNILRPGPAILATGSQGSAVRDLQARLKAIQWYFGDVTGSYDAATVEAVRGFQAKREIPVTGDVDQRTLDRLHGMTAVPTHEQLHNIEPQPGALDPRCRTGRVLCVDKSTNSLRWVVDGDVVATFDVRFGSDELPTREGRFSVFAKSRDHVSSLYDTAMPFAMFFSGGQAVHYSPDFAAVGYSGASHGCVNVRDYAGIAWLYDQVQIGDAVVVYWS
ncbi:L,D-transpeptidase family protein [Nocardioides coralli]|uniref:L,D-transpeptidase family protein n=1 Tax=Nocardioides coralli TaxID=2872154 RepID=UPI001CA38B83|nr:peptidoglycan-binding protein [Nocardioides coralli]QZY29478.1 peptidoglycan-binding protein [Nocardioides coralli]